MQAVKQPVILEGFDHREALKMLLLLDEVWLMLFVALLILFTLYILHKTQKQTPELFYKKRCS